MVIESLDTIGFEDGADVRVPAEGKDAVSHTVRDDVDARPSALHPAKLWAVRNQGD